MNAKILKQAINSRESWGKQSDSNISMAGICHLRIVVDGMSPPKFVWRAHFSCQESNAGQDDSWYVPRESDTRTSPPVWDSLN
jgi:hypothetical protein